VTVRETLKVKERRDDTTKTGDESRPPAREPGAYYYDDATGYEPYTPEEGEDEPEGEARDGEEG
jgi:hypothetical protein